MLRPTFETIQEFLGSGPTGESRSKDLFSGGEIKSRRRHRVFRPRRGEGLPVVVAPADGDLEDFFASVATFYPDHAPISSLAHIVAGRTAELVSTWNGLPMLPNGEKARAAIIGASIGEATLAGSLVQHGVQPSYSACRRTLAFALGRALNLYGPSVSSDVMTRWTELRRFSGLPAPKYAVDAVMHATLPYTDAPFSPSVHVDVMRALREFADGRREVIEQLIDQLYPALRGQLDAMKGAFDTRMETFSRIARGIQSESRGTNTDEIAIGYVCNLILPGSFAHVGVLARLEQFFPAALIWYGMFAAVTDLAALQQTTRGLTVKLERDLNENFSFEERPRCDISWDELQVLSRLPLRGDIIKPMHARSISVSLIPGIDLFARFEKSDGNGEDVRRSGVADQEMRSKLSVLLKQALDLVVRDDPSRTPGSTRHYRQGK